MDADGINDNYELSTRKSDPTNIELAKTVMLMIVGRYRDSKL